MNVYVCMCVCIHVSLLSLSSQLYVLTQSVSGATAARGVSAARSDASEHCSARLLPGGHAHSNSRGYAGWNSSGKKVH